ncbi:amidohydrolase family protein [Aliirhizobium terrae]|uniref:amidohydrolase family protein n=1 Tax=Terrirhizobium terrae TaxID=2926709 RepID=UPI0025772F9E|nr:amidohydrolase family protein [Rhizobium sp. CC-CFT758]WJH41515.1 amidohydrolase family protein [Rhizobium sp. CC-CFT758]
MQKFPLWDGPIVDAHQHFWDPVANDHPWLKPEANIPFRYGDYSSIKRRYLPPEYLEDSAGYNVVQTVYVETEWDPSDPIGETRYATKVAETFGLPNAIVAQAWLDRTDVADVLEGQASFGLVRSIRHKPGGAENAASAADHRTLMTDEKWRRGYALLERHGLNFDLQTNWWHLDEAILLARDFPNTTIILNHTGLPSDRSSEGIRGWHRAMGKFAEMPNVCVKISGIGQQGRPWTIEDNGYIIAETIAMFSCERAMFASNFPVDSLCGSFNEIYSGFRDAAARYPTREQAKLFAETARKHYRLKTPNEDVLSISEPASRRASSSR